MNETPQSISESRARRLTDAFAVGIALREELRDGASVLTAIQSVHLETDSFSDGYAAWHPASYPFMEMVRLFLYHEVTGESYQSLSEYPELAAELGLEKTPGASVLSRTWRNRFHDDTREFIETAAHFLVKEVHDREDLTVPAVRPKTEVTPDDDASEAAEETGRAFADEEIHRTTRLARQHTFDAFESGRDENASYDDAQFFELQTFLGMTGCGTAQGAARFQYRERGETPHGDTHLRTAKQFSPEELVEGVDDAVSRLTSVIESEAAFRRPVTVAIDITTVPYYGDVDGMEMVSGIEGEEERAFKFATLSVVGYNVPLILAVEPIRESSPWDENPPNEVHRVVRRLVRRAQQHVSIETVLCDREFDSKAVFQTLSNLDVNYLIPTRRGPSEEEVLEEMNARSEAVAVERARLRVETGAHECRFLYVPSSSGEGIVIFVTNVDVRPEMAVSFCRRYSRRWQIEAEYKSIKGDFLAKTSSKDYRVRLFYFVFAVLLYNVWRVTSFLLEVTVRSVEEVEYSPVLTAGECAEVIAAGLDPPG